MKTTFPFAQRHLPLWGPIALAFLFSSCGVEKATSPEEAGDDIAESVSALSLVNASQIQFALIDADSDRAIAGYENLAVGQVIDVKLLSAKNLSIEARVASTLGAKSVRIKLGTGLSKTENEAPYSLFGDTDGNFKAGALPLGNFELSAVAYSSAYAGGSILAANAIRVSIVSIGVTPIPPPPPSPTPTPTVIVEPSPLPPPPPPPSGACLEAPTPQATFGPNGTHWPKLVKTPFLYDCDRTRVPNRIEVNPTWADIAAALKSIDATEAAAGTMILVRPGTISSSPDGWRTVLENVGSKSWSKRVTIAPRDGYGSVVITGKPEFKGFFGIALAGFPMDQLKCRECTRSALAWLRIKTYLQVVSHSSDTSNLTHTLELAEVVMPEVMVRSDDTFDIYAAKGSIENVHIVGSYFAPRFYVYPYTGDKPHTDTFQMASTGGGKYSKIRVEDSVFYSSNNCSIQTGNVKDFQLHHSLAISGAMSLERYPHMKGGATEATTNAFNGSGIYLQAYDSVIIGGMGLNTKDAPQPWSVVSNTLTSKTYTGMNQPLSGAWTVDLDLMNDYPHPTEPTNDHLDRIWFDKYR